MQHENDNLIILAKFNYVITHEIKLINHLVYCPTGV